jgi:hypothetical protein
MCRTILLCRQKRVYDCYYYYLSSSFGHAALEQVRAFSVRQLTLRNPFAPLVHVIIIIIFIKHVYEGDWNRDTVLS